MLVQRVRVPHGAIVRVCRQFLVDEGIDTCYWAPCLSDLNPLEHLWDILFRSIRCCQVASQTVQELSDVLVQLVRRSPWTPSVVHTLSGMHTSMWGPYKLRSSILSCCSDISGK